MLNSEPSVSVGTFVSAILLGTWLILKSTGVNVTEDLRNGVEAIVYAFAAMPFVASFIIRWMVTPTGRAEKALDDQAANAQDAIEKAFVATPGQPKPVLNASPPPADTPQVR